MNPRYDVAIVGYGPVGQLLATVLGDRGHRVLVVERHPGLFTMPRAAHFDHEVARILQSVGVRADTSSYIEPYDDMYQWRNRDGDTLLELDWSGTGPSWWSTSNFFVQHELERDLDARARSKPSVTVRHSTTAVALGQDPDGVTLTLRAEDGGAEVVTARWVVGADGANSTVGNLVGAHRTDLGFQFDWLIVDVIPHQPMRFDPPAWQLCDPRRPTTLVPGGPGRRRWEFMALPGEDPAELNRTDVAWRLLEPWGVTPGTAQLERHAVYRFQAQWLDRWRHGRVLLAGDAAHLMPPFAGQGMCAGLRDVANLAWKLDLVLTEKVPDALLDTYGPERAAHVRTFINQSIELGRVICVTDEEAAAARDAALKAAAADLQAPPPPPQPRLGPGLVHPDDPAAGYLAIQSSVRHGGRSGLFDDVFGAGWSILTTAPDTALGDTGARVATALGMSVVRFVAPGSEPGSTPVDTDTVDTDGRYLAWFSALGVDTVVVRPDHYVYAAIRADELPVALETLGGQLKITDTGKDDRATTAGAAVATAPIA